MTDSASITVTNHRLRKAMSNANNDDLTSHTKKEGEKLRSELKLQIGEIIELHPDTETVKATIDGKTETCLIAHDMFSEGMSIIGYPKGKTTLQHKEEHIVPSGKLYGIIANVNHKGNDKRILLSYVNLNKYNQLKNCKAGEYKIQVGDNIISITDNYIKINGKNLFINGLPYGSPKLKNYYDKNKIDQIQENNTIKINEINEKLESIDIIAFKDSFAVEVTVLPDPSNETLGKIYLIKVTGTDDYDKYITFQKTDNSYVWEKIGSGEGGTSTVLWSNITDKPSSFTPSPHVHGSLQNDGTLNSTSETVKNIAVTDNDNNLKTIGKIPYSKISNTPTIPTKISDLSNDSNFIETSNNSGLIRNDGTIDSSTYLTSIPSHNHDSRYYTESEINEALSHKQDTLSSGVNIKTINGNDITGSGNINISGGSASVCVSEMGVDTTDPMDVVLYLDACDSGSGGLSFDDVYPVGSIYMSVNNTSPSSLFGGTWEQLQDRFLLGASSNYTAGGTGGEATHTLTVNEMPSHNHTYLTSPHSWSERDSSESQIISPSTGVAKKVTKTTNNTGGGQAHNNMPPYLAVYMWKRTA